MQSTAATVLNDVIFSVDHSQVFSPLQSKESTTSPSPAIVTQLKQWVCGWWRTERRWLLWSTIQLEPAGRQQPTAWLCSLKWETGCPSASCQTPGFVIMITTTSAPSRAICYSFCEWNQVKMRTSWWKQLFSFRFHVNSDVENETSVNCIRLIYSSLW